MAQFKDGDSRNINGITYVRQGGMWLPQASPNNPKLSGEITAQTLGNQRTKQEIDLANATAAAQAAKAKADAQKAQIDAETAQENYDAQHPNVQKSGLYGPDYLKTLSASDQAMVRALDEGRLAFPQGAALRAPFWQEKLLQVSQFDPTFDATNYNARAQGRAAAINGKLGTSNNALNTAIGHLGTLENQISGTASHNFTPYNVIANSTSKMFGDPGVTNFQDTAQKLADELESVYRNGGGAEQGVVRQLRSLDVNASQAQKEGVIQNAMDLLASKMAANLAQYNFGTGGKPTWDMLDQHTLQVLSSPRFQSIRDKYFVAPQAPGNPPPPGNDLGPGGVNPSNGGSSDKPSPELAAYWENAARSNTPYGLALKGYSSAFPGMTLTTPPPPSNYDQVRAYMQAHPNQEYHPFAAVTRTPMTAVESGLNVAAQTGPVAGATHFGDKALGSVPSLLAGDQGAYFNDLSYRQHPYYSFLGDVGGTVAGAIGAGKVLGRTAPYLGKVGQFLTKNPARQALAGDLGFGFGSGAAQNPNDPVTGGITGAAAMGAGNVAGRYVLGPALAAAGDTAVGQGVTNAALRFGNGVRGMFGGGSEVPPTFNPPPPLNTGQSLVMRGISNGMGDIRANLQDAANAGLPYTLADAHPKLRLLAGSATRKSPDVRTLAENVIAPRQLGQGERAIAQINTNLAPVGDVPAIKADAVTRAQQASSPLYEQAMSHPAPNDPQLNEMLDTPAGQQAVRNAYTIALNNGEKPGDLSFGTDANGNPILKGAPNWKTLQYTKMGLDKVVLDNQNPITGKLDLSDPASRALNDLRGRFVTRLGDLNPDYKAANAAYQGIVGQGTAAERGAAATSARVTPEQAQIAVHNAGDNLPYFQRGYASNLADTIERQRLSGNPYDLINGSMGQQSKLGIVFPQGASQFARAQALEGDMGRTAYETLGGSPTQPRAEADRMFDAPGLDAAAEGAQLLMTGAPSVRTMARLGLKLGDMGRLGIRGAKAKADAVGPLLLNPDPAANLAALDQFRRMDLARQLYQQRVGAAGGQIGAGMFGAPILLGYSQN